MKDNDKILILKLLLKATFVLLVISVFLKLLGLNVFGIDTSNVILINLSNFIEKYYLKNIIDWMLLFTHYFIFFKLCSDCRSEIKFIFYSFLASSLTLIFQFSLYGLNILGNANNSLVYFALTFLILFIFPIFLNYANITKRKNLLIYIKKQTILIIIISLYQLIAIFLRNITFSPATESINDIVLNFDYTILLLSTYYIHIKEENNINLKFDFGFSITKFLNSTISLDEIKDFVYKLKDFKKKFNSSNKTDKIIIILYLFFSILSELINLSLVIFVACLNHVLIECLFIITSFLISRKVFGAFHLDSAIKCWFMSNVTFYILSRISFGIKISYVAPIILGIMLSYITSKFIKNNNKELYKGIKEEDLKEISNGKRLTKLEYEILKNYYCKGVNINNLTFIYHYSRAQLYRYKTNAEKKIAS